MLQVTSLSPTEVASLEDDHPLASLVDSLEENFIAYCRMFAGLPGVVWQERHDSLLFMSPGGPPGIHVLRTQFDESQVETQIDGLINQIAAYTDRFDWAIYRNSSPHDIAERLIDKGLTPGTVPWLLADLDDVPKITPLNDEFRIEVVTDAAQMEEWWHVSAAGFECDDDQIKLFYDAYVRYPLHAGADCVHYVGYWQDEAVTSATLLLTEGIAGLYNISTPPQHRRRGFGAAITYATLQTAKARGFQYACCIASPMGKPIYQRLGFRVELNAPEYQWQAGEE